ncbi:DNA oxidative demethylase ALKBH2 [Araneus ventricosus]|uniref:DNA oxidative demethylase ALKBH2 n=1 Tax=Araneus ventricosus TaxID=182803 RepID=A0A4Y2FTY6_ARAVE|nr:DNA oxidative demethylase ALKBH2 [Araneus ventricosus]
MKCSQNFQSAPSNNQSSKSGVNPIETLRKSCSYGDMDIEYEYSGHCELPLPWNRTLWKIKSDVEKKTGFEYNFVLLNFYESGQAKIGAHKDDEPSLDPSVDIATLSFGACRDMIFSKKGCKSVRQALEAGSLLLMHDQPVGVASPKLSRILLKNLSFPLPLRG